MEVQKSQYVSWTVFAWAIGVFTIILTFIGSNQLSISEAQNSANVEYARIQEKLLNIEVTVLEIKQTLKENNK